MGNDVLLLMFVGSLGATAENRGGYGMGGRMLTGGCRECRIRLGCGGHAGREGLGLALGTNNSRAAKRANWGCLLLPVLWLYWGDQETIRWTDGKMGCCELHLKWQQ